MAERLPPIYFYIPREKWISEKLPEDITSSRTWQCKGGVTDGDYAWSLVPYLHLKDGKIPCEFTGNLPTEGILISHRLSLPDDLRPGPKLLLVCCLGDKSNPEFRGPHFFAHIHVVQNPTEEMLSWNQSFWRTYYMPHWTQSGLIPRDPARGDLFENIAFFGKKEGLASELRSKDWLDRIKNLGLTLHIVDDSERWHDYSFVDVVIAIRDFEGKDLPWKPATKLYNAWHAVVPAVLGYESAYRAERKSELDYIEANSPEDTFLALRRLRDDRELRRRMVENGRIRAKETSVDIMITRWSDLISDVVVPAYYKWCNTPRWAKEVFLKYRSSAYISKKIYKSTIRIIKQSIVQTRVSIAFRTRLRSIFSRVKKPKVFK